MEMLVPSILLFVGLLAVIKGGDWFVDAASGIARAFGVPSFLIGATVVSIATTLPELIVSCTGAANHTEAGVDMAIGNAVGSVTANTGLIMGVAFLFLPMVIRRKDYIVQCLMLVLAAVLLLVGSLRGSLSVIASAALLLLFAAFMGMNVRDALKQSKLTPDDDAAREKQEARSHMVKFIILFIVGAALIVVGSRLLVDNGTKLAAAMGIPDRVIAVTLVAVGTSLPELITTLTAIRKKEAGLSVGNIIGANIIDLSLILPVCSFIAGRPIPVPVNSLMMDIPVCLGIILLALVPMLIRQKTGKVQGFAILLPYLAYVAYTVFCMS